MARTSRKPLRRTAWRIILPGLVLLIAVGGFWFTRKNPGAEGMPRDFSGQVHRISEFRGEWVLLHFWASWCLPCVHEIPEWVALAGKSVKAIPQLRFVAVSWDDSWEEAHTIIPSPEKLPPNVVSLRDASGKTAEAYGSFQLPETYLLDPEGKVIYKWIGPQVWGDPKISEQLKKLKQS